MSIYINNVDKIAEHFSTTPEHVIDVYTQASAYSGHMWSNYIISSIICIIVLTVLCLFIIHESGFTNGCGKLFFIGVMISLALIIVFILGSFLLSFIVSTSPEMIEYNMYLNWISSNIGL